MKAISQQPSFRLRICKPSGAFVSAIFRVVSESTFDPANADKGDAVRPQPAASATKRRILAALVSALAPGAGQLFLGFRRKGVVLLLVFAALISCVWPLRLPQFFGALILLILVWLGLLLYATYTALFEHGSPPVPQKLSKWWILTIPPLVYLGINVVFTPIFLVSGFRARRVESSAMQPTLLIGDQFILDTDYYRHHPVGRNDLVIVHRNDYQTVKRVIAAGGDTIKGENRNIVVNGQFVNEPFIQHSRAVGTNPELDSFGPVSTPAGKYFVMGDNRDVSLDSRMPDFGLLSIE